MITQRRLAAGVYGVVLVAIGYNVATPDPKPAERPGYDVVGQDEITGIDFDDADTNVYFDNFTDPETGVTWRCLVVAIDPQAVPGAVPLLDVEGCARKEEP